MRGEGNRTGVVASQLIILPLNILQLFAIDCECSYSLPENQLKSSINVPEVTCEQILGGGGGTPPIAIYGSDCF